MIAQRLANNTSKLISPAKTSSLFQGAVRRVAQTVKEVEKGAKRSLWSHTEALHEQTDTSKFDGLL